MVTQDGDHAIRFVVRIKLLLYGGFAGCVVVKLLLEGDRGVVGTEDLCSEAFHVRCKLLVDRRCLSDDKFELVYAHQNLAYAR